MYEICQNEFHPGVRAKLRKRDVAVIFLSASECDLDVKYRCIIARERRVVCASLSRVRGIRALLFFFLRRIYLFVLFTG